MATFRNSMTKFMVLIIATLGIVETLARGPSILKSSLAVSSMLNNGKDEMYVTVEEVDMLKVYTLKRGKVEVKVTNWGATVMSVKVPDASGKVDDIVLGYDTPADYGAPNSTAYFGAIVGRVANRIANGSFKLRGKVYNLYKNNGNNTLHGGRIGFDKVIWQAEELDLGFGPSVQFTYNSFDGEEGFPGNLEVSVIYTLCDNAEMKIEMEAKAGKKATPVNLASHTYWNLRGQSSGEILDHLLQIFAQSYTPVDGTLIPTGEIRSVKGTALDFLEQHAVGEKIDEVNENTGGYDHNYVLEDGDCDELKKAVRVVDPVSGRVMEIFTNQPGMQFYTSNFLQDVGKGGSVYGPRNAYCFETQGFPNAINEPKFPSIVVEPGQIYKHVMVHRFSTC